MASLLIDKYVVVVVVVDSGSGDMMSLMSTAMC